MYNVDETALKYRMLGEKTLAFSNGKKNKECVTILSPFCRLQHVWQ